MNKASPKRILFFKALAVFLTLIILLFGSSFVNLARIQLIHGDRYKEKAEKNQLHDAQIAAERGIIYDANGTVLAKSASVWKIYIKPNKIQNEIKNDVVREEFKNDLCRKLFEITGVKIEKIRDKVDKSKYAYLVVKRRVEFEEKEKIETLLNQYYSYTEIDYSDGDIENHRERKIPYADAVGIDPDVKRYYPYGTLASNVIGFAGADDIGRAGLEFTYDEILAGIPGRIITAQNGRGDVMNREFETVYDAVKGTSLVLTIDEVIQRYLENSLERLYAESKGRGAYGIVMNVNTGAVTAMASIKNYDLNFPQRLSDEEEAELERDYADAKERSEARNEMLFERWKNFMVSDVYEPGSVFKIITLSAALEEDVVSPETSYTCTGKIKVADRIMKCHKRSGHGTQNLKQGLMNSCNPFFITIGQKLGKEKFFEYFEAFGFTEKTGIDLPGEVEPRAGLNYHALERMGQVELSSSAFGQSFEATPMQIITAISAIANGGKLMTPYLVQKQLDENGDVVKTTRPRVRRRVISEKTAETVTEMMEAVVSSGTGKNAYVPGYRVAGKTGTSQKLRKSQKLHKGGFYVASFGCFAPADAPEIAVLILVDEPKGQINGGQICAPAAAEVVEKTLEYLGVERRYNEKEIKNLDATTPNVIGENAADARRLLENDGFEVRVVGKGGTVISQTPPYNQTIPKNGIIAVYTEESEERLTAVVPDLKRMGVTEASRRAASAGLNIKISGNFLNEGELVSYDQSVAPGEEVEYGKTVAVYFKSNTNVNDYAG